MTGVHDFGYGSTSLFCEWWLPRIFLFDCLGERQCRVLLVDQDGLILICRLLEQSFFHNADLKEELDENSRGCVYHGKLSVDVFVLVRACGMCLLAGPRCIF